MASPQTGGAFSLSFLSTALQSSDGAAMTNKTTQWPSSKGGSCIYYSLGVFVIFPIRFILLCIILLSGYLSASLCICFPLSPIRRRTAVSFLLLPHLRLLLFIVGIRIKEEGRPPPPNIRIICSNHVAGLWEAVYLLWRTRGALIVDVSSASQPIMRTFSKALGFIVTHRDTPGKVLGITSGIAAISAAVHDLQSPQLCLFPEACCSNGNQLLVFKSGAFRPLVAVAPVVITFHGLDCDSLDISYVTDGPRLGSLLWRLLTSPAGVELRAKWCPIVTPTPTTTTSTTNASSVGNSDSKLIKMLNNEPDRVTLFSDHVRLVMSNKLDAVPVVANNNLLLSLEDALLGATVRSMKGGNIIRVKPVAALIGLNSVQKIVRITLNETKVILRAASLNNADPDGSVDVNSFVAIILSLANVKSGNGDGYTSIKSTLANVFHTILSILLVDNASDASASRKGSCTAGRLTLREVIIFIAVLDGREILTQDNNNNYDESSHEAGGSESRHKLFSALDNWDKSKGSRRGKGGTSPLAALFNIESSLLQLAVSSGVK